MAHERTRTKWRVRRRRGKDRKFLKVALATLRRGVKSTNRLHLVTEEIHAYRSRSIQGVNIYKTAAHGKLARCLAHRLALVVETLFQHPSKGVQTRRLTTPHGKLSPSQRIRLRTGLAKGFRRTCDDKWRGGAMPVMAQGGHHRKQVTHALKDILSGIRRANGRRQGEDARHKIADLA